jgi:hypothetical protein
LANYFYFSKPTKFLPYVCLFPNGLYAIPVSISAVSLTGRQTWPNVNRKRRLQRIQNVQERKDIRKKRHLAAFVFVPSVFGEKFPSAEF